MVLDELKAEVSSYSDSEQELAKRISEMLAGGPPRSLRVGETDKQLLLQRLRFQDHAVLQSGGEGPPP